MPCAGSWIFPLLAVDEAHCISQWGQDFRPSYLKISEFLAQLPRRPVLAAFTATATEAVRKDIAQILGLQDPLCMITGFDRPNLFFDVLQPQKRSSELRRLIAGRSGKAASYIAPPVPRWSGSAPISRRMAFLPSATTQGWKMLSGSRIRTTSNMTAPASW